VEGFIVPEAGVVAMRAVQSGRIARVLVRNGQRVVAGAPLIEFTSDTSSIGQGPVLDVQLQETERQIRALGERRGAVIESFSNDRERLEGQIQANLRTRSILIEQRGVQQDALKLAESNAERISTLQAQGYAPNIEVDNRRRSVLTERSALGEIEGRISQLDAATENMLSQQMSLPARLAEAIAAIDGEQATLVQKSAELAVARGHVLRAPMAGTISSLQARVGLLPAADQTLLSLSPEGSPLEARLLAPTRATGFLRIGQRARLQVDAFPFQRFGFVEGRIVDIATTVTTPGEGGFPTAQTEPVYEIRVLIDRSYVEAYGERRDLRPGMALRADLPIDRRRLWQQLFDPLLAAGKRAL